MNKYAALLALALTACGDTYLVGDDTFGPSDAGAEYGQTAQALTVLDGYGVDKNQNRCWTDGHQFDWGGGQCHIPSVRKIYVNVQLGGCSSLGAADMLAGTADGLNYTRGVANDLGWTVLSSLSTLNPGSGPMIKVDLDCGVALPGQDGQGQAGTQVTAGPGTCTSTQDGQLCKYTSAKVRIVPARMSATPGWSTANGAARRSFIFNVVAHEVGHVVGLGHDLCGPIDGDLAQLMAGNACQDGNVRNSWRAGLTQFEKDMLAAYRP